MADKRLLVWLLGSFGLLTLLVIFFCFTQSYEDCITTLRREARANSCRCHDRQARCLMACMENKFDNKDKVPGSEILDVIRAHALPCAADSHLLLLLDSALSRDLIFMAKLGSLDGMEGMTFLGSRAAPLEDGTSHADNQELEELQFHWAEMSKNRVLFRWYDGALPKDPYRSPRQLDALTDAVMEKRMGARYLWLQRKLPFGLFFPGRLELRLHAYVKPDLERDTETFMLQLFIAHNTAPRRCTAR